MDAIKVKRLSKTYKDKTQALNELSLTVRQGEVFALLGANGAGKSTLINILTTFLQPTSGDISVLGYDPVKEAAKVRREIACVAQKNSIDNHLTLKENMRFQGRLYQMDKATIENQMDFLMSSFGLQDYSDKRVTAYSGGIKRRLDIAMSLMSSPKILFLDEPTVGMDIESRRDMWNFVRKIRSELHTTVFLTTHYLEEADMLSDTICIMQNGHEITQDTPDNLKRYTMQPCVRVSYSNPEAAAELTTLLSHEAFVHDTFCVENSLTLLVEDAQRDYRQVSKLVLNSGVAQTGIEIARPTLDDVFLALTQERVV